MFDTLAKAWLDAHCPWKAVQRDFLRDLAKCELRGRNCWFALGPELTKGKKPYLLCFFAGELFVFELDPRQARNLDAVGRSMVVRQFGGERELLRGPPRIARIDGFHLDGSRRRADTSPLTGQCAFEIEAPLLAPYSAMLMFPLGANRTVTQWCYPMEQLFPPGGMLRLAFPPIRLDSNSSDPIWTGTTVLFLRLCLTPNSQRPEGRLPITNTCATLIDVDHNTG